ncbi:hypothetical protein KKF34_10100 [Myxococcota bacterium]|nr:hypothetical protein [Myxococcota bacterium]MBU1382519.1 hypothetical protein [Myxococcota bacterium]MBU1497218.1 hypothetical protein [Myxococcota bacterium]
MIGTDKSKRLATRLLRIIERNKDSHPVIKTIHERTTNRALSFLEAAERWTIARSLMRKEKKEGLLALKELKKTARCFVPVLSDLYPHLKINMSIVNKNTVDDIFTEIVQLIYNIESETGYGECATSKESIRVLKSCLDAAIEEWKEFENLQAEVAESSAALNAERKVFNNELRIIRRTLASAIGRTHPDVRRLTLKSSTSKDTEDPDD